MRPLSATEVRLLSELLHCRAGTSPTDLARRAGLARPTIYVLLRRLAQLGCVTRRTEAQSVRYRINLAGRRARINFARRTGLSP